MRIKNITIFILFILFVQLINSSFASEKQIIKTAETFNNNMLYYNAITETMRYQFLYPGGKYFPKSMLIMSEAFRKGGNYSKAINTLSECYTKYKDRPEGEEALYMTGFTRLSMGSSYFAYRTFQDYLYIYEKGRFTEDVLFDMCFTLILLKDLDSAKKASSDYSKKYKNGKYFKEIKDLQQLIDDEINRPQKNVWVSAIGSVFVPGFGHFYTGKYGVGALSLISNALFMYLFYDGYRDRDKTRMIVFGLAELSVYNYSLYSSVRNVHEYNEHSEFYKAIALRLEKKF
ncbi:MAG: hypothetical protein JW864_17840 [Spirochaetes bacterium]|nr:hypothetical protein [Spirochaetota bacterium]